MNASPALQLGLYCLAISVFSLVGGLLPGWVKMTHTRTQTIMSFVAGLMLGVAFYHLLPHSITSLEGLGAVDVSVWWMMVGLVVMLLLLRMFHFHQHEFPVTGDEHHGHDHVELPTHTLGWLGIALGLALHTVIDGMALGAAMQGELATDAGGGVLAIGVFLAILLHKPLDALSITSIMQAGGWSRRWQLGTNLVFALMCPLGALLFFFGVEVFNDIGRYAVGVALAFSAGAFVCIALSDLLPEVHFHSHDRVRLTLAFIVGILLGLRAGLLRTRGPARSPGLTSWRTAMPRRVIYPPMWLLLGLAAVFALDKSAPGLRFTHTGWQLAGAVVIIAGLTLLVLAGGLFKTGRNRHDPVPQRHRPGDRRRVPLVAQPHVPGYGPGTSGYCADGGRCKRPGGAVGLRHRGGVALHPTRGGPAGGTVSRGLRCLPPAGPTLVVRTLLAQLDAFRPRAAVLLIAAFLNGCSSNYLPYTTETTPMVLLPLSVAGVEDQRGRFREIFCAVLDARVDELPDIRPCESALSLVGLEPAGSGRPVPLGAGSRPLTIAFVPGVGWNCVEKWLEPADAGLDNLRRYGYDGELVRVDALSSGAVNARQIRDWVLAYAERRPERELVLAGYSKGGPDVLRAVVDYPEILPHVAAVVSLAGSVGGSPLANNATQSQLDLLTLWPGADCDEGDGEALDSLTPERRRRWLAANPLPDGLPYYSLVTYPDPDRISSVLRTTWRRLAKIDGRNDSQVLFYDQIVPGSSLVAYLNADHWAVAVPVSRSHRVLGSLLVNRNDYPREALIESLARFIDEDLGSRATAAADR